MRRIAFILAAWTALASAPASAWEHGDYLDLPSVTQAADPHVIEADGVYYLYPTTTGVSVECWSSEDLVDWTYEGVVWGPAPSGSWNDRDVWAPGVYEEEGVYYLYYTADDQIGVASSTAPTGPFTDVFDHPLIGGGYGGVWFKAIDAFVFRDDDGRRFLYATGYDPWSFLRVWTMPDPVTVDEEWTRLLDPDLLSWEMYCLEGPWLLKRGGVYYLMYSGSGANLRFYAIGYATATDPLGPFDKSPDNPILSSDPTDAFWGPGHHAAVVAPDDEWRILYHTKLAPEEGWARAIRSDRMAFTPSGKLWVDVGQEPPADDDADDDIDDDADDDIDDDTDDDIDDDADDDIDDDTDDDGDDDIDDDALDDDEDDDTASDDDACGC